MATMTRRERLDHAVSGNRVDRLPVALWRHFPGDDQRVVDFAQSIVGFQQRYDWDFVMIHPASSYSVEDYGIQSVWNNAPNGDRTIVKYAVTRSLEWTEIRSLDPQRGEFGKQIAVIQMVREQLGDEVPILLMVYSPLAQAERLGGWTLLQRHLRTHSDRVRSALSVLTESTLRFIEALKRTSLDGICYAVEHADYDRLSEAEYAMFGLPYDQKILGELGGFSLNMLHIGGNAAMFTILKDYPVQGVIWNATGDNKPDLPTGKSMILGAVGGGLDSQNAMLYETPTTLRSAIQAARAMTNERRLILTTERAIYPSVPLANLRAVRSAVEPTSRGGI